jgi:hypothetical protein
MGERLTTLEGWRETIDARLWGDGGSVAYERSLEGRVSAMESAWRQADALADAARELRRTAGHSRPELALFDFAPPWCNNGGMSETKFETFSVRVPEGVAKRLRKVAKRELSSLNREVNIAIRAHLDAEERRTR